MRNVHAMRKYGVDLPVFFFGYTSTSTSEQCELHAFFVGYWRTIERLQNV